jgi:hypothetical protein
MPKRNMPFIMSVVNANNVYGMRFTYPHEVVKYENALQANPNTEFQREHRMTCPECNTFKPRDHIMKHEPHPTLEGM